MALHSRERLVERAELVLQVLVVVQQLFVQLWVLVEHLVAGQRDRLANGCKRATDRAMFDLLSLTKVSRADACHESGESSHSCSEARILKIWVHSQRDRIGFKGFGWVKGSVKKIKLNNKDLKLPHMGWNEIKIVKKNDLFLDIENLSHFYFVHSYAFEAENINDVVCTTDYEKSVVAAILKENIFGTQFHPEKSQENGIKLLSNFLNWNL